MSDLVLDDMDRVIAEIARSVKALETRGVLPRRGSRYADEGADDDVLAVLARGGSVDDLKTVPNTSFRSGPARGGGISASMRKALAEGIPTAGGVLVDPEVSAEIVKLIRARSAVQRLGPRTVSVKKSLAVNDVAAGSQAYYTAENSQIPVSEMEFAQRVLLEPRDLAALVPISDRLLRDASSNPDVDQVIRSDIAEVLALAGDAAFLRGDGVDETPLGILNVPNKTAAPSLGNNGAVPTFDNLKDMVAALRAVNAPFMRPGWCFNPRLLSTLEKVKDLQDRYLADAGLLTFDAMGGGGTLLGFPFTTTTQIPINLTVGNSSDCTEIYFSSDWNECWIGEEMSLTIEVSAEASYWDGAAWISAFQNRQHLFRAVTTHDIGLRRPGLFSVMIGVRA